MYPLATTPTPPQTLVAKTPNPAVSNAALSFPSEVLINVAQRLERKDQRALGIACKTYTERMNPVLLEWRLPTKIKKIHEPGKEFNQLTRNFNPSTKRFNTIFARLEENRFRLNVAALSDALSQLTDSIYYLDDAAQGPAFQKIVQSLEWLAVPWRARVLVKLQQLLAAIPEILDPLKDGLNSACSNLKSIDTSHAELVSAVEEIAALDVSVMTPKSGKKILAKIEKLPADLRGIALGLVPIMHKHLWSPKVATQIIEIAASSEDIRASLLILLGNNLLYLLDPENNEGRPLCNPQPVTLKRVLLRMAEQIPTLGAHHAQTLTEILIHVVRLTPAHGHAYGRSLALVKICLQHNFSTDSTWQALLPLCDAAFRERQPRLEILTQFFQAWTKCQSKSVDHAKLALRFVTALPLQARTVLLPMLWNWGLEELDENSRHGCLELLLAATNLEEMIALSEQTLVAAEAAQRKDVWRTAAETLNGLLKRLEQVDDGDIKEALLGSLLKQAEKLPSAYVDGLLVTLATCRYYRKPLAEAVKLNMVFQRCKELDPHCQQKVLSKIFAHQLQSTPDELRDEFYRKQVTLIQKLGADFIAQGWSEMAMSGRKVSPAELAALLAASTKLSDQDKVTLCTAVLAPELATLATLATKSGDQFDDYFKAAGLAENLPRVGSLLALLKKQSPAVIQAVLKQLAQSLLAFPRQSRQVMAEPMGALAAEVSTAFQEELAALLNKNPQLTLANPVSDPSL